MGNSGSTGGNSRRRNSNRHHHHHHAAPPVPPPPSPPPPPPQQQQQQQAPPAESAGNRYVFAAATPYPPQYPNPNPPPYYQYTGYYPPPPPAMPVPLPAPFDHHQQQQQHQQHPGWAGGPRYPYPTQKPAPYVEHQKAVTIRNDINLKKETLRIEPDEENPGKFLIAFTFDATIAGRITVLFFAKEGIDCNLTSVKENLLEPITVTFKEGLAQKFRQSCGTGIDFSLFTEEELVKEGETEVYPLAVKAEASSTDKEGPPDENQKTGTPNSQITLAMFEKKENGKYQVRVLKQILRVNRIRYELQEIYGIGNSVDSDFNGNDPGKECVICLSEPRDTTVLPCRHMCMCSGCAKVLRFQTDRCPICRQLVERLLEIKVNNRGEES